MVWQPMLTKRSLVGQISLADTLSADCFSNLVMEDEDGGFVVIDVGGGGGGVVSGDGIGVEVVARPDSVPPPPLPPLSCSSVLNE